MSRKRRSGVPACLGLVLRLRMAMHPTPWAMLRLVDPDIFHLDRDTTHRTARLIVRRSPARRLR